MYTLGIDIGSTTSKCAVIKDGTELVATSLQTGGLGTGGPEEALAALWRSSGLTAADMARTVVTGYGRKNYEGADGEISEPTPWAAASCSPTCGRSSTSAARTPRSSPCPPPAKW